MMLRWLVSNWLRQAAQEQLRSAVTEAMHKGQHEQAEVDDEVPLPPVEVVVIFGSSVESGGFVDLLQNRVMTRYESHTEHRGEVDGHQIVVAESGVGQEAAGDVAMHLLQLHEPKWVVSAGFAAALQPALRRGHMVMSRQIKDTTGTALPVGLPVDESSASASLHFGNLLTVDKLIRKREEKQSLGVEHDALACDMESFAIARVCQAMNAKSLSVRIVTDTLDDELPAEIERLASQNSIAGKLGAATGAIFNRPSSVKDMWKLKEDALKATDRLAKFLRGVIEQLP